ncbi:hypothetical protein L6654_41280 [Bradyrhizobium sp. WYCCWR 13023]|uniref:Uncharacterized protein n=1 Tax=Bradyrhizobium zhengyangense TaxID=2911009 RepID=A0A9X1UF06_9BRAD|nr:hypothetical protein [Bradyrhizobium zhengyangense]MCG2632999.1 hypothetical protein [Bradyrhizobium zhengyangense]
MTGLVNRFDNLWVISANPTKAKECGLDVRFSETFQNLIGVSLNARLEARPLMLICGLFML